MNEIRLVLVDDHDVVRTSLKTYLESHKGFRVVGEANNGEAALQVILDNQPDVVVMDITMPGMSGLEATKRIKVSSPNCKVLALTVHNDKQYFFEMLSVGAVGYLTKQAAAEELIAAIQAVADGDVYLQPALARWLKDSKSLEVLSKRELQVLELVAQGLTTPQIAETLGISPKTVARHRERIMNKLDLHSIAELVKFAIQTGLIKI